MAQFINFGSGKNGSVASATGTVNSYAAASGTSGQTTITTALSVSSGDQVVLITMRGTNVGQWELVQVSSTGSGSFTSTTPLVNTYAGLSQAILIPQYSGGTCSNTITGTSWNGNVGGVIAMIVNGDFTLTGTISINGSAGGDGVTGTTGGATGGGYYGGNCFTGNASTSASTGEGTSGASVANQYTANGNGGGGGQATGGSNSGAGGGNGTAGGNGTGSTTGGNAVGDTTLTSIFMGGGGGGSNKDNNSSSAGGGSGAGILLIIAKNIDISSGTISLNGGRGGNASNGGGGGGAGGSCLVKCQTAVLGTNKITATGGSGGTGNQTGGAGGVGRIRIDYLTSVSGTTNPTLSSAQDTTLTDFTGKIINFIF